MNKGEVYAFEETQEIMKKQQVFIDSHLELPVSLTLANSLKDDEQYKEVRDQLWEYALTK
jgi:hypothetical protein